MAAQIRRMNWVRTKTVWEQHQASQKKREANRQVYQQQREAAVAAFGNAFSSQITGISELVMQQAAKRIQAAAVAKRAELQTQLDKLA